MVSKNGVSSYWPTETFNGPGTSENICDIGLKTDPFDDSHYSDRVFGNNNEVPVPQKELNLGYYDKYYTQRCIRFPSSDRNNECFRDIEVYDTGKHHNLLKPKTKTVKKSRSLRKMGSMFFKSSKRKSENKAEQQLKGNGAIQGKEDEKSLIESIFSRSTVLTDDVLAKLSPHSTGEDIVTEKKELGLDFDVVTGATLVGSIEKHTPEDKDVLLVSDKTTLNYNKTIKNLLTRRERPTIKRKGSRVFGKLFRSRSFLAREKKDDKADNECAIKKDSHDICANENTKDDKINDKKENDYEHIGKRETDMSSIYSSVKELKSDRDPIQFEPKFNETTNAYYDVVKLNPYDTTNIFSDVESGNDSYNQGPTLFDYKPKRESKTLTEKYLGGSGRALSEDLKKVPFDLTIEEENKGAPSLRKKLSVIFARKEGLSSKISLSSITSKKKLYNEDEWNPYNSILRLTNGKEENLQVDSEDALVNGDNNPFQDEQQTDKQLPKDFSNTSSPIKTPSASRITCVKVGGSSDSTDSERVKFDEKTPLASGSKFGFYYYE